MDPPQPPNVGKSAAGDDGSGGNSEGTDLICHDVVPRTDDNRFTKVLTQQDLDPQLRIDCFDAVTLTGDLKLFELPAASGSVSKLIHVVDDDGRAYSMMLSDYLRPGVWAGFSISGDWGQFVKRHQLRAGDRIFFFKNPNPFGLANYFFKVRFVRMPSVPTVVLTETPDGIIHRTREWR